MKYELYEVGGAVRDAFLGVKSKDIDYSVILEDKSLSIEEAFKLFKLQLELEGFEVYTTKVKFLTISAKFPSNHIHSGVADFVLARKELGYKKDSREPIVVLGTLEDDLIRRDFTANTLAKSSDGDIIDLFNGQSDLQNKILRTPMDTSMSFNQDPLRILRGIRFAITKDLNFSDEIWPAIGSFQASKLAVVSAERIRDELFKCFKHNTLETLEYLIHIRDINPRLYLAMFPKGMWLLPTTKG